MFLIIGNPTDYVILDVNPSFESIIGISREQALNQKASILYGETPAPFLEKYSNVATTQTPKKFEAYYPPLDKYFQISVMSPKTLQFATIFSDISEHKRAEQKLAASEAELRTIFSAMSDVVIVYDADGRYVRIAPTNPENYTKCAR